ncbi:MAG: PAS domain-containing protein [Alphaproteobacteria bacterium]|nr:PAS domain-containing protein [Alphaproteobacteria bacterium]
MPRCVFKLLWDTIESGKEIFAYVKNMAKNGDHYWVLAHATPSFDRHGAIVGYHSTRRVPDRAAVAAVDKVYRQLLAEENRHADRRRGIQAAHDMLVAFLREQKMDYDEFVFATSPEAS